MSAKVILILCAQALFIQSALSQCLGRAAVADIGPKCPLGYTRESYGMAGLKCPLGYGDSLGYDGAYGLGGCGYGGPGIEFSPTSGGALPVSSASAVAPVGLSVASENVYEGILAAAGELPFVGTVGVEGTLPTAGAGVVSHACGNGVNAMVSSGTGYNGAFGTGDVGAYGLGLGTRGLGYLSGCAGKRCGCGIY